jgi:hypothetical protein|tara:strand:- start:799 stop:1119 length:321 start_codon:yes stop_codon:yes gene_type:complete
MTKEKKKTVDKGYYKIRQEDRADLATTIGHIEAWAERIAGISSLYNQRCLISNNGDPMDLELRDITASAIEDLRAAFDKLAKGEAILDEWLAEHKTGLMSKILFFS